MNTYDTILLERIANAMDSSSENSEEPKIGFMNVSVKEDIDIEKLLTEKDVTWQDSLLDSTRLVFSKVPFTKEEKEVLIRMWRACGYTGFIQFFTK